MSEYVIPVNDLFVRSLYPFGIPGLATDELRIAFLQATAPVSYTHLTLPTKA